MGPPGPRTVAAAAVRRSPLARGEDISLTEWLSCAKAVLSDEAASGSCARSPDRPATAAARRDGSGARETSAGRPPCAVPRTAPAPPGDGLACLPGSVRSCSGRGPRTPGTRRAPRAPGVRPRRARGRRSPAPGPPPVCGSPPAAHPLPGGPLPRCPGPGGLRRRRRAGRRARRPPGRTAFGARCARRGRGTRSPAARSPALRSPAPPLPRTAGRGGGPWPLIRACRAS